MTTSRRILNASACAKQLVMDIRLAHQTACRDDRNEALILLIADTIAPAVNLARRLEEIVDCFPDDSSEKPKTPTSKKTK